MTSDEFSARFRLLKCITEMGVHSYTAVELASERAVMVHFLDSAAPDASRTLLRRLEQLPPPERARVSETLEVDGTPVVITQVLQNFETLPTWVSARLAEQPTIKIRIRGEHERPVTPPAFPAASAPPAIPAAPARPAGDFTQLFGRPPAPSDDAPAPAAPPAKPAEPSITPEKRPAPARPAGGGFTEIFTRAAIAGDVPADPPAPPAGARGSGAAGGQFTRFLDPSPPAQSASAPPSPNDHHPLDRPVGGAPPPSPLPSFAPPPLPTTFPGFTAVGPGPEAGRSGHNSSSTPPPPIADGPSEFTRIIARGTPAALASGAALLPARPEPTRKTSYAPLIALLGGLVVVAVALVTFLVMRR
jgi:hypothetical protein